MLASQIVRSLPESLHWMVLFDLSMLRRLVSDEVVRNMFLLPESTDLGLHSHVVLSSQGMMVAARDGSRLSDPVSETIFSEGETEASLYGRFSERFDLFSLDDADCLAIGETPPFPPVLLHVRSEAGDGEARAVFCEEPSEQHYELLKAVGVEYLGGTRMGPYYLAHFRHHLPIHIHAAELAHFTRGSHCNMFFLRHGSIDRQLEQGLIKASANRVSWAAARAREAVVLIANEAVAKKETALTDQPLAPADSFAGEDVIPLGFLLRALNCPTSSASIFSNAGTRMGLVSLLQRQRQDSLWSDHDLGLATSTTTALVLQGLYDSEGIEALQVFADGRGGYHPDFATTCLIRSLRNDAELDCIPGVEYLASRFESRSGLYFANPYLVDWAFALALRNDESAHELAELLAAEILASMNNDYSFGLFDVGMSSAFAILSLAALGHSGRTLRVAQLRLLDFMEPNGTFPAGTPFYSARAQAEVSLDADGQKAMSTAAATLALLAECSSAERDSGWIAEQHLQAHPRYGCRSHEEYVQRFALPPYVGESERV